MFQLLGLVSSCEVQAKIDTLDKRFHDLKNKIRECLESCNIAVKRVADALTSLRPDDVAEHQQFTESHISAFFKAANRSELLIPTGTSYLNYPLLDHQFHLKEVKGVLEAYKEDIQQFREKTPLTLFCQTQKRRHIKPPSEFEEMVAEFDLPDDVTLEVVEQFRQEYACYYGLHKCAMMVAVVQRSSECAKSVVMMTEANCIMITTNQPLGIMFLHMWYFKVQNSMLTKMHGLHITYAY